MRCNTSRTRAPVRASAAGCTTSTRRTVDVPPAERENVLFLIAHHLDLSSIMNSRDLNDPATARYMAERIGAVERLRMLTLLTWADISAVNPAARALAPPPVLPPGV